MRDAFANYDDWKLATPPEYDAPETPDPVYHCGNCGHTHDFATADAAWRTERRVTPFGQIATVYLPCPACDMGGDGATDFEITRTDADDSDEYDGPDTEPERD